MVEETFGQPFRRGRETRAEHRTVAAKGNVIADESPNLHSERALLPILDLETSLEIGHTTSNCFCIAAFSTLLSTLQTFGTASALWSSTEIGW